MPLFKVTLAHDNGNAADEDSTLDDVVKADSAIQAIGMWAKANGVIYFENQGERGYGTASEITFPDAGGLPSYVNPEGEQYTAERRGDDIVITEYHTDAAEYPTLLAVPYGQGH